MTTHIAPLPALDPRDPELVADPWARYAEIRRAGPVVQVGDGDEALLAVGRHADVLDVLGRPSDFSSRVTNRPPLPPEPSPEADAIRARGHGLVPVLVTADPPAHARHRRLVQYGFSGRRIRQLADVIRDAAASLLDAMPRTGHVELRSAFAEPLPLRMVATALGLPTDDVDRIHGWSDAVVARIGRRLTAAEQVGVATRNLELQHYLEAAVESRRRDPQDDLLTDIVRAQDDVNEPLTPAEVMNVLEQLLVAGNETTTRLIVFTLHRLATDPDLQRRVRDRPDDLAPLAEEMLRLESPVQSRVRVASHDTTIAGLPVLEGERLLVLLAAANHDPDVFPQPERLDLDRTNLREHTAFGYGPHYCIGATLGRQEARIAIESVLDRWGDVRLSVDHPSPAYEPTLVHRGLERLDLVVA